MGFSDSVSMFFVELFKENKKLKTALIAIIWVFVVLFFVEAAIGGVNLVRGKSAKFGFGLIKLNESTKGVPEYVISPEIDSIKTDTTISNNQLNTNTESVKNKSVVGKKELTRNNQIQKPHINYQSPQFNAGRDMSNISVTYNNGIKQRSLTPAVLDDFVLANVKKLPINLYYYTTEEEVKNFAYHIEKELEARGAKVKSKWGAIIDLKNPSDSDFYYGYNKDSSISIAVWPQKLR